MNRKTIVLIGVLAATLPAAAQTQPPSGKGLAATLNVYVFPNKGQSATAAGKS